MSEPSEAHHDHPEHCGVCGQFIGPIGACKDCFPPEPSGYRLKKAEYLINTSIWYWVGIAVLYLAVVLGVAAYV